jgi:hypothetical protein
MRDGVLNDAGRGLQPRPERFSGSPGRTIGLVPKYKRFGRGECPIRHVSGSSLPTNTAAVCAVSMIFSNASWQGRPGISCPSSNQTFRSHACYALASCRTAALSRLSWLRKTFPGDTAPAASPSLPRSAPTRHPDAARNAEEGATPQKRCREDKEERPENRRRQGDSHHTTTLAVEPAA